MVMDLQDVSATLEESVAQSQIRLFGSSSKHLTVDPSYNELVEDDENDDDSEDDEGGSDLDFEDGSIDDDSEYASEDDQTDLQAGDRGRSTMRNPLRSTKNIPAGAVQTGKDIEYADSDSDIGDGYYNEGIPDEQKEDISSDEDEDEEAPRWKANMASRAQKSFQFHSQKNRRKDWMKLIYLSSLTPDQILKDDAPAADAEEGASDDDFFKLRRKGVGLMMWWI